MEYDLGVMHARRIIAALQSRWPDGYEDCALTWFTHRVLRIMDQLGVRTPEQLEARILEDAESQYAEWVSLLIPPTTELFRDPDFWIALREEVLLPLRAREEGGGSIWVAGFDSGEELYSLCLLLASVGLLDGSAIVASHLLPHEWLRNGLTLPPKRVELDMANASSVVGAEFCASRCVVSDGACVLDGSLVAGVRFARQPIRFGRWDDRPAHVVLCRNHLLYYGLACGNANLDVMADALVPGGALAVGIGENLVNYQNGAKFTVLNERESIYRKLKM